MPTEMQEWYAGRSVFVTGGTGFMGKVLLEKLLRALPDLNKVYILIRPKRGLSASERIDAITKVPLFDRLRDEEGVSIFKKLIALNGDLSQEGLGLSDQDIDILKRDVSVVYHAGASLRLEAELKENIIQNTLATKRVMDLCTQLPKLEAAIHLSTAFCHCDVELLDEKVYPPTKDPYDMIRLINWMDEKTLNLITPNIMAPHPNSYTFSKRLAETIVDDYFPKVPAVILRPSIVIPTLRDPMPGWVDSLNGPVGLIAAAGKGVIRTMLVNPENHAEVMPVDVAINAMIGMAPYRASRTFTETPVFNLSQADYLSITWGEVFERGKVIGYNHPFEWMVWYPDGIIGTNVWRHKLTILLCHILPAYFLDFIFFIVRQPRFMVRVQKRISLGLELLQYFTLREWRFSNKKILALLSEMSPGDMELFYSINVEYDIDDYLIKALIGTRKYVLKEDIKSIPRCRINLKILYVLDRTVKFALLALIAWTLFKWLDPSQYTAALRG